MASGQFDTVLRHLRRTLAGDASAGVSDAQLLERFVSRRDESAFELLVWRHERLVFNVCRRLLRDHADAEDAFQATFLALVRRAGSIGKREAVAAWLYKVAYRVALRVRMASAQRSQRERLGVDLESLPGEDGPATEAMWRELRPLLDQEVSRLPERYRVPVILCYLEGKTYDEIARQLGCSRGTVSTWLTRARELLRKRLERRGVVLAGGVLATLLAGRTASAVAPPALVHGTVKAALPYAAGKAAVAGLVSAKVAALTEGVLHAMMMTRIKTVGAVVLLTLVFGLGTGLLVQPSVFEQSAFANNEPSLVREPGLGNSKADDPPARADRPPSAPGVDKPKIAPPPEPPGSDPVDRVLREWERAAAAVETLVAHFTRIEENKTFQTKEVFEGTFRFMKPSLGILELHKKDKPDEFEKFVFTDKALFLYNRAQKTVVSFPLPPSRPPPNGPLKGTTDYLQTMQTLLFGMNLDEARRRYEIKLTKEDEWYCYLDIKPRTKADEADFSQLRVVLSKGTYLPRQFWYEQPNRDAVTWDITRIDTPVPLKREEFEQPVLPDGWTMKMMFAGKSAAGPRDEEEERDRRMKPKTTGSAAVSGDRLDQLVQEVVRSQRNDEQAAEALCLATLARYPTETEKKFIVDYLATHKDRREALTHVLGQLIQSKEFDANLDTLNQRKPRH
jgi:TIGR03009 family protein